MYPASATGRLRCLENGVGMACSPTSSRTLSLSSRSGWPMPPRSRPARGCASTIVRCFLRTAASGPTAEAAVADLRAALEALLAEAGPPDELTPTLDFA